MESDAIGWGRLASRWWVLALLAVRSRSNGSRTHIRVAIIDLRGPNDPGLAHDTFRSFAVRARLDRDFGTHTNQVIWKGPVPLDRSSYEVTFSDAQWSQLQATFPDGVCDYAKPGVSQQPTIPWLTYQTAGGRVIYGGRALGPAPASIPLSRAAARRLLESFS